MASFSNVIVETPVKVISPTTRIIETVVASTPIKTIPGTEQSFPENMILRRSSSLDSADCLPEIRRATTQEDLEDRVDTFEEWKARTSATALTVSAAAIFVGASYKNSTHWKDWVGALSWHASLWIIPHVMVHRKKTPLNVLGFILSLMPLVFQPHMEISRKVSYVGAIHGSASVIVLCRALQFYLNQEEFKGWKPFRRMFFISAWGWHDFRQIKYVGDSKLKPELRRLAKWTSIMVATVLFHLWWGKPSDLGHKSVFAPKVLRYFLLRWGVGFWTLLAWFNAMDAFPRALHFWADGHELRHISEDPWEATTLRSFWGKRWNVPVIDMLQNGVFRPITKLKWLPMRKTIAKLMVFVVSASGHTYAISCGGSPWKHLLAMYSFFMVQVPLLALEDTFKFEGLTWMLGAQIPFAPLFIEPCLTFVHL